MVDAVRAVIVDPSSPGRLGVASVSRPEPDRGEALVRVRALSLNLGEVRRISAAEHGWRPGWDFAGVVETRAADGTGPSAGTRVVGMLDTGAWSEVVAVPVNRLAALPDPVSFAEAATLPVAGLTALRALERGGMLLGKSVLITGASGGVGHLACMLAHSAGARVVGTVRTEAREKTVRDAGADEVVLESDVETARQHGPYHTILESVGGERFSQVLSMLAPGGTAVVYGTSAGSDLSFDGRAFYLTGGASLYGFILFHEIALNPPAEDLGRLCRLVADGRVKPQISVEAPWEEIGRIAQDLADRKVTGKAVLHIGDPS